MQLHLFLRNATNNVVSKRFHQVYNFFSSILCIVLQLSLLQWFSTFLVAERQNFETNFVNRWTLKTKEKGHVKTKSRQPCYAQPIQAKLIPDCKDSFLHCFTWTSRLHLFSSRLCPIFSRRLAPNNDTQ